MVQAVRSKDGLGRGGRLEYPAEGQEGGFVLVPPYVPEREIDASPDELRVLVRSDNEP